MEELTRNWDSISKQQMLYFPEESSEFQNSGLSLGEIFVPHPGAMHLLLHHQLSRLRPLFFYREVKDRSDLKLSCYRITGWQSAIEDEGPKFKKVKTLIHFQDDQDHQNNQEKTKIKQREIWNYLVLLDRSQQVVGGEWGGRNPIEWVSIDRGSCSLYHHLFKECHAPFSLFCNQRMERFLRGHYATVAGESVIKTLERMKTYFFDHIFDQRRVRNRIVLEAYRRFAVKWSAMTFLEHLYFCSDALIRNCLIEEFFHLRYDYLTPSEKQMLLRGLFPQRQENYYSGDMVRKRLEHFLE